ncbi:MAG: hypothetical protein EBQ99_05220, partial [Planctomycetes bacterium]|nr:hypothetical protein [Planctomycetota bacterium]
MRPLHPDCTAALSVLGAVALLGLSWGRLSPSTLRFPSEDPPCTGVPIWRVDLDHAGRDELGLLPGVGERLAERIMADRARH